MPIFFILSGTQNKPRTLNNKLCKWSLVQTVMYTLISNGYHITYSIWDIDMTTKTHLCLMIKKNVVSWVNLLWWTCRRCKYLIYQDSYFIKLRTPRLTGWYNRTVQWVLMLYISYRYLISTFKRYIKFDLFQVAVIVKYCLHSSTLTKEVTLKCRISPAPSLPYDTCIPSSLYSQTIFIFFPIR